MVNKRFLKTAERWRNPSLPDEKTKQQAQIPVNISNTGFPDNPSESFIFSYDGEHGQFFQELIAKNNELFGGTRAEIPTGDTGEVINMYLIKRAGLITAIYNNPQLRSHNLYPITPTQSEHLFSQGNLPKPNDYWEDLCLILYSRSENGKNPQESRALYESLKQHKQELELSQSDLEGRLIVVNPGLDKDTSMPHGGKLIVLPGITQAYTHEVLEKVGEDSSFEGYGLQGGLPLIKQLGDGDRTLWMPNETQDMGLRVLIRGRDSNLGAWYGSLVSSANGRVNFALKGQSP